MTIVTMTMGAALVIWLGDQVTERGVGNGMALILITGLLGGLPSGAYNI